MEYFSKSGALSLAAGVACGLLLGWKLHGHYSYLTRNSSLETCEEENENEENVIGENGDIKLALIVRSNLKLHKGKVAAHCSYAAICAHKQLRKRNPEWLREWELCGQPTIVYKAPDQSALVGLHTHAEDLGISTSLIQYAGSTQTGAVSPSVLAVGPGPASQIDAITKNVKLY